MKTAAIQPVRLTAEQLQLPNQFMPLVKGFLKSVIYVQKVVQTFLLAFLLLEVIYCFIPHTTTHNFLTGMAARLILHCDMMTRSFNPSITLTTLCQRIYEVMNNVSKDGIPKLKSVHMLQYIQKVKIKGAFLWIICKSNVITYCNDVV